MIYRVILDTEAGHSKRQFDCETPQDFTTAMVQSGFAASGINNTPRQRRELNGQPCFATLLGPMWDGDAVRYESAKVYAELSS